MKWPHYFHLIFLLSFFGCGAQSPSIREDPRSIQAAENLAPQVGAEQMEDLLPLLKGKKVGLVVNQTSLIQGVHLVDTLLKRNVQVTTIFGPEHGFRGESDAGAKIKDGIDPTTGLPVKSLYGKTKKPTTDMLSECEVMVFDIQDVGARFYTFISTMHYVMEAAAAHSLGVIVLDRPNPNGHFVDGPVLEMPFQSFVGMHPIPIVHGMTVGELAQMINGEKWIPTPCDLTVIPCKHYDHNVQFELPIAPSPNLPNHVSVAWYPSLCLFEATKYSIGRGTPFPFQVAGAPGDTSLGTFSFTPASIPGKSTHPKHQGVSCTGIDLRASTPPSTELDLSLLLNAYSGKDFITRPSFFNKLAGTSALANQLEAGLSEEEIRASWKPALDQFRILRKKYLLYKDFEDDE